MPRDRNNDLTQSDKDEYKRLVKNVKSKLGRIKKNHGIDLSERVNIPRFSEFPDKESFNFWKKDMKEVTRRNNKNFQFRTNQYGLTISETDVQNIENMIEKYNKKVAEVMTKLNAKETVERGIKTGQTAQEQARIQARVKDIYRPIEPFDFNSSKFMNSDDVYKYVENLMRLSDEYNFDQRQEIFKDNLIRSIEGTFSDPEITRDLVERLRRIRADHFLEMYYTFNEFSFNNWDSEGQLMTAEEDNVAILESYVDLYEQGKLDFFSTQDKNYRG
jgi:hypothetical protein